MIKNWIYRTIGLVAMSSCALSAWAAPESDWPNRTITLVVPYTPGGLSDQVGRLVADSLSQKLGQVVIVDNKPGAGTGIGSQYVARAKPDGYTFLLGGISNVMNLHLYRKPLYGKNDLLPVAQLDVIPMYLVTAPNSKFKTVGDIIKQSKDKPESVSCGNFGTGSSGHLACKMLARMAGIELVDVPYKGGMPAIQDTMAGLVDTSMVTEGLPFIEGKKLYGIAVTTPKRNPYLPEIPTIGETVPGYDMTAWGGIFAPAGTPDAIVQRVATTLQEILASESMKSKFKANGILPTYRNPKDFKSYVNDEYDRWGTIIKEANIHLD